jgi:SAM-dependent methyltransferase
MRELPHRSMAITPRSSAAPSDDRRASSAATRRRRPIVGAPRSSSCRRTIEVITGRLARLAELRGSRLLDVGCGDGSFTIPLGARFDAVYGVDVQERGLDAFRRRVAGDRRFTIAKMSAEALAFPDASFDTLVSIETIEHIAGLKRAVAEFHRVVRPGGHCLITCPNRLFPFENHGVRLGRRELAARIPLLPYLPPLHDRFALARVFTVRALDRLFGAVGFRRVALEYAWPTFEHGGNPAQRLLRPLSGLMRSLEDSPVRCFGSSIVVGYVKPAGLDSSAGAASAPLDDRSLGRGATSRKRSSTTLR